MSKQEIVEFIKTLNDSLDIQFLESLSKTELDGYVEHLKAVRQRTRAFTSREPVHASTH